MASDIFSLRCFFFYATDIVEFENFVELLLFCMSYTPHCIYDLHTVPHINNKSQFPVFTCLQLQVNVKEIQVNLCWQEVCGIYCRPFHLMVPPRFSYILADCSWKCTIITKRKYWQNYILHNRSIRTTKNIQQKQIMKMH